MCTESGIEPTSSGVALFDAAFRDGSIDLSGRARTGGCQQRCGSWHGKIRAGATDWPVDICGFEAGNSMTNGYFGCGV